MSVNANSFARLGQANFSGDTEKLFKEYFVPELITAFETNRKMVNYVRKKTISNAKSAAFPVLGTTGAKYVGVGESLLGNQKIAHNEIIINVDPFLVSDILIHEFDVKLQAYEDRAEICTEMGRALADTEDQQLAQVGVLAARANGIVEGRAGGTVLKQGATVATNSDALIEALTLAAVELDNKKVPEADRAAFVRPLQYARLAQNANVINKDIGGGSFEFGLTGSIGGLKIVKTTSLPSTNIQQSSDTTKPNNIYYGDFTNTVALVMNKGAVGTVSVQGLITEAKWMLEFLGHLCVARILQGHGILRPDCAVEISSATDSTSITEDEDGTGT